MKAPIGCPKPPMTAMIKMLMVEWVDTVPGEMPML